MWTDRRAEVTGELVVVGAGEILDRDDAEVGEPGRRPRPDSPDLGDRLGAHRRDPLASGQACDASRLGGPRCSLRQQPGVTDPNSARQPGPGRDRRLDVVSERLGIVGGDADERLVPAPHLDGRWERAQRGHDLGRRRVVGRSIGRQENRVGAATQRLRQRHP